MLKLIVGKAAQLVTTLLGVTFLTFCLAFLAPGDPAMMILEAGDVIVSKELIEQTRVELGLDKPFIVQYGNWIKGVLQGDLGMSYSGKKPVTEKLMEGLPATLALTAAATVVMLCLAVPLGVLSALHKNKPLDYLLRGFSFIAVSMPAFWFGLLLLYVFGLKLRLVPIATAEVNFQNVILPAFTAALTVTGKYMRQVRLTVLEELNKDYVIGALARGMHRNRVLFRHILPNTMLPLITLLGMAIGWLLGGVAVIEMIFSWPGLGKMVVGAITMRDYPLIEGFVLWAATAYLFVNFMVDLSYARLDPKLRKGGAK